MGTVISTESSIKENELLVRLSGKEPISDNDPFWNKLFSFNFTIDETKRVNQKQFYDDLKELFEFFLFNAPTSGNFASLIKVFLRRSTELDISIKCDNKIFIWQSTNSLIILRYLFTFFLQRLSQSEFAHQFESKPNDTGSEDGSEIQEEDDEEFSSVAEKFLANLINIVTTLPVNPSTVSLHAEAVRCILVLLSPQMFEEFVSENVFFLKSLMKMTNKANNLTKTLLTNIIEQKEILPTEIKEEQAESLVLSLASSLWSSFARTVSLETPPEESEDELGVDVYPKQTLSLLSSNLLLTLVCYNRFDGDVNAFRLAIEKCQNSQEVSSLVSPDISFRIDFSDLYSHFCDSATEPISMLLLYVLIHRNSGFKNFVLARINLESLVLPIVKALNEGISAQSFKSSCRHTYLSMIVLLILSEDSFFCKIVHETMVKNIDWYQDKMLQEISLGGLIILVCVKTVHLNTVKMRDRYLHQNCLAALANMSSGFRDLSTFVCQKIIGLLETMTRRHSKLIQMMRDNAEDCEDLEDSQGFDLHQDISALEEGIRTILEMINACLTNNLRHNPHLIYAILYNRQLFEQFHNHPMFQDLVWNIYLVINHFANLVQEAKVESVDAVHNTIAKAALQWPTDRLKRFPDLKFIPMKAADDLRFFHRFNSFAAFLVGISLNSLLIFFIIRSRVEEVKQYGKILLQIAVIDSAYSFITTAVQPITLTVDGVNYFVQNGPLRHVPQPYNFYIFLVWFYFHFMQFFSVPIQFIYRYLILCRNTKISNRKYFCFFIPSMIVVFFQTVFFGLIYKHEEIHDLNATRDIGRWLLESGESTVHLTCVGPPGDIGVLMGNVETICFIGLNYIIIGLCAFRIHVHLQRSKGHFSVRTAAMHKSFTRLLFIQGVLPIVSSIGPTLLICYVYVFRLSLVNFAFFLDFCNAWLPTVGASFVLFIFKPFRSQIFRRIFPSIKIMSNTTNRTVNEIVNNAHISHL